MTSPMRYRALAGLPRARLLAHLRASSEPLGVQQLADAIGLHANTVRDHLQQLVDAGLVVREVAAPAGRGRPQLRFSAHPDDRDDDPRPYQALARVLADQLAERPDAVWAATEAGERWGRATVADQPAVSDDAEAVARIVELLDAHGFAPEVPTRIGDPIRLRRCPFGTLAVGRERVVCGVHLGLMRGALAELGADIDATRLDPFVRPDLCVAHLARRADA